MFTAALAAGGTAAAFEAELERAGRRRALDGGIAVVRESRRDRGAAGGGIDCCVGSGAGGGGMEMLRDWLRTAGRVAAFWAEVAA